MEIKFTAEEKQAMIPRIKLYLRKELDKEVGNFDAEFLLDFFAQEIGPFFYNRGLYDAQALLEQRMDHITEALAELEKPIPTRR